MHTKLVGKQMQILRGEILGKNALNWLSGWKIKLSPSCLTQLSVGRGTAKFTHVSL